MIELIIGTLLGGILLGGLGNNEKNNYYREDNERLKLSYEKERIALNQFNARKQELISSFSNQLFLDFSKDLDNNFCETEINEEYENNLASEFNEYIKKIIDSENEGNLFSLRVDNSSDKLTKKMSGQEINHLNILLLGPSGVGKSTLINSILKLDEKKEAKAKITKPTTKEFNVYESEKISNIRLIDSRGIEKGDYNIEEFVNEVKKFIEDRELDGNPDNFIHCIWYCITGTRFEDIEEKTLLTLTSIYDDLKLPIIVVYTQAIIPNYYNSINDEIKKINENIEFIPVISKEIELSEGKTIKSKNLDKLLFKSLDKAKNAVYSSVFSSLRKNIKNEIENEIKNNLNEAKNILNKKVPIKDDDKENINYDEEMKYDDILKTILFGHESNKYFKESSKEIIKELINKTKDEKNKIYGNCLNNFAEKQTSELINKLLDLQSEINEKNEGNLKEYKSSQQFKDEIIPQIFNSLYNQMEDRGINSLHLKIIDLMSEIVEGELISLISSDSTKNNLDSKIKKQFERIMSIVEGFNFK